MANKKILIIEDDENLVRLLTEVLKSKGYETQSFLTGKEALTYLDDDANVESLNLIILDRLLPEMDGIEILHTFREKYGDKVPVLILSTLSAEKDVLEGLQKGAIDYITKPFNTSLVLQKVDNLVK